MLNMKNAKYNKKILFVLPTLAGGGAERVSCNLINRLYRDGVDVSLFLYKKEGEYIDLLNKNIVIYTGGNNAGLCTVFWRLLRISSKYDVIVGCSEFMPTYLVVMAAIVQNKKSIGWVHTNIDAALKDEGLFKSVIHKFLLVPIFYGCVSRIIFVSNGAKKSFSKYLRNSSLGKVECIYNPIDLDMIVDKGKQKIESIEAYPMLTAVGRLEKVKNYPLLFEAFKLFLNEYPNAKLIILGEGSLKESLQQQVKDMGIINNIIFKGFQQNPYPYIKQSDILVMSSRFEGLPTVLIEALRLGTDIVTVDCPGGIREILNNGSLGIIVENDNPVSLCKGLKMAVENKRMKNNLKDEINEACNRFSFARVIPQFKKIFDLSI